MDTDKNRERLSINLGSDLAKRLEYCSSRYGVSKNQLAVFLIGQGVAGIEASFKAVDNMSKDLVKNVSEIDNI